MNDKHYPAGSEKGGQFAPKNASSVGENVNSIDFVPKNTSNGQKRTFFIDKPIEEKQKIAKNYVDKFANYFTVSSDLKNEYETIKDDSMKRQLQRMQWLDDEKRRQDKLGPKRQEKKATIVLGLPGSGKSTFTNPLMQNMGAYSVDADDFKNHIPEFKENPETIQRVHEESVNLSNRFMDDLSDKGYNLVIGKVGGSYFGIKNILNNLSNKGYKINLVLNDVPMEECINRSVTRYEKGETDRLVPMMIYVASDKHIFETFDKAMNHKAVTNGRIYNNDVPYGEKPVLLKEYQK